MRFRGQVRHGTGQALGAPGRTGAVACHRLDCRRRPRFLTPLVLLASLMAAVTGWPSGEDDSLAPCDAYYKAGDLEASRQAAADILAEQPDSYAATWRLARVLIDLGNKDPDKEARRGFYEEAERQARRAVQLDEGDTWGHHYLAASVGKLALFYGGKKKIELSREVREEALRAIALDPRNDKSLHILGRWNREIANLSAVKKLAAKVVYGGVPEGASNENAVSYFRQAIAIAPEHINHHLELGITLMEMRQYAEAEQEFQSALTLPESDPNDPEYQAEAREQLQKAQRKLEQPRKDRSR
jgi:tetratricopeptide (TPR) repeat protein